LATVAALSVRAQGQPITSAPKPAAAKTFAEAYAAASAQAAKAFEAAQSVDAAKLIAPLSDLAVGDADKRKIASLSAAVQQMDGLKTPVAAKASADGEPLDADYKAQVLALAQRLAGDGDAALKTRRDLLAAGPGGPKQGQAPGQNASGRPSAEALAAVGQNEARNAAAAARAGRIAQGLEQDKTDGTAVPSAGAASAPQAAAGVMRAGDFVANTDAHRSLKISDVPEPGGLSAAPALAPHTEEFGGERILGYSNSTMKLRAAVAYDANQSLGQDVVEVNKGIAELEGRYEKDCASLGSSSCLANRGALVAGYSKRALDGIGLKMTGANGVEETGMLAYSFTPIGALHVSAKDVIEDPSSKGNWGMLALAVIPFSGTVRTAARGLQAGEKFASYAARVGGQAAESAELVEASASEGARLARLTTEARGDLTKARDAGTGQFNEDERSK
jgi:hypothetical protein